ncbi:class I SAM-dependent RNA methyltransferase [Nitrobacter winogradskyi]|uniref:23S rRNA (Uracil1939-C5)-methyltransferase n=2 Tax=Nitrobacter winogradskyi TaxID=913 RepID=A0ACC6AM46_NITWI|nr:class I SAM-dependent RNA methyltransferase [Nitrobacter winogradskyi]MCP2000731.1 23S rRNA (uracil1939-C5)-methyltransferase [Nitrobacter winogradskyi]GEC15011.1 putative RNA methyltransferase [Nitrobacter winogradskyi]
MDRQNLQIGGTKRVTIDHVGHRGDGVARTDRGNVYVPYALGGETVEIEPLDGDAGRARLLRIEAASPDRIAPFCSHFGACGGCAIQHWRPEEYRAWKRRIVIDTLALARIDCNVDDLIDAHGAGRRRITLHARSDGGKLRVGFAAPNSHAIVPIDACPVLDPALHGAIDAARELAMALKPANKPLDIQVTATRNGLDVDVRGSGQLPPALIATLSRVAEVHWLARLTRHGELVLMRAAPVIEIGAARLVLPPGSFLQATVAGEETLAALVAAHCGKARHIADLFCGVGPFALRLAVRARVTAFDSNTAAVTALQKAADTASGLKPIKAESRDLFRRPLVAQELRDIDAAIFDPPRQGAETQSKHLATSRIPVVVAVSCSAATFARDARILIDGGYSLEAVTPVDQFRHSPHVELVAKFVRRR